MNSMRRLVCLLALSALLCGLLPVRALAASTPTIEKGLLITPLRQFLSVGAGSAIKSTFTVANLTDEPLSVSLSVKQFSVTDYVYNYTFNDPTNDWLHLGLKNVTLAPNQSQSIPYELDVPAGSAPGGHYYTLFASANLSSQGVNNTIQAADLVYLTVNGKLIHTSHLQDSSIQRLSFGHTIPFRLQPVNTGNVYSFIYVSGQLHGLFVHAPQTAAAHLIMPGKVRALSSSIPSPVFPGIYRATYGYKTADANWVVQESHWVVFIPPWFIAFLLAALLIGGKFLPRKKSSKNSKPKPDPSHSPDE